MNKFAQIVAMANALNDGTFNPPRLPNFKSKRGKTKKVRDNKTNPKIGRNEPCPCGSGIKYKKCCALTNK